MPVTITRTPPAKPRPPEPIEHIELVCPVDPERDSLKVFAFFDSMRIEGYRGDLVTSLEVPMAEMREFAQAILELADQKENQ